MHVLQFSSCRSQLSEVSEQLACQHAQMLRAQQSEATPEQICAERIAEQQLRIKQVMKQRTSLSLLLLLRKVHTYTHCPFFRKIVAQQIVRSWLLSD